MAQPRCVQYAIHLIVTVDGLFVAVDLDFKGVVQLDVWYIEYLHCTSNISKLHNNTWFIITSSSVLHSGTSSMMYAQVFGHVS